MRKKNREKWERKIDRKVVNNEGREVMKKVRGKWERRIDSKGLNNEGREKSEEKG